MTEDETIGNSQRVLAAIGAVIVLGALLLMPIRHPGRILGVLFDFAHVPVFAAFVFIIIRLFGGQKPAWVLAASLGAGAAVLGLAGELAQDLVGRSAGIGDAISNAVGAAIGFTGATWPQWSRRPRRVLAVCLVGLTAAVWFNPTRTLVDISRQRNEFPILSSFEHELELCRWQSENSDLAISSRHASHGQTSLQWTLQPGQYPGCVLRWPINDWSNFQLLEFDVWNEDSEPIEITTKIEDFHHSGQYADRFHERTTLRQGKTTVRIRMDRVRSAPESRETDMKLISRVALFTIDLNKTRVLYIDRMELTGARSAE